MKALTLTQPWATLVAIGAKQIETRSWTTDYRGSLAIHAAKDFPRLAIELCFEEPFAAVLRGAGIRQPADLPRGCVIATARLTGCRHTTPDLFGSWVLGISDQEAAFGDFSSNRYGWFLDTIVPLLSPVPARGALGLWEWQQQGPSTPLVHYGGNGYGECGAGYEDDPRLAGHAAVTKELAAVTCPTCRGWLPIVAPARSAA